MLLCSSRNVWFRAVHPGKPAGVAQRCAAPSHGRLIPTTRHQAAHQEPATEEQPSSSNNESTSSSPSSPARSNAAKDVFDPQYAQELLDELQDQSQLGQRGEGWTIAQFVAIALVLLPPFHAAELTNLVGVLLLLAGLGAMTLGLQSLGTALTPLPAPRKDSQLVTTGAYEYLRHPMYGGLLMASLGLAAVTHDESRLLAAAVLWLVLEQKVDFEERLLTERYGAAYEEYRRRVKKFIPYLY